MLEGKNNKKAWLYLLPVLILLGIFSFYPIINTFIVSFIRDYYPIKEVFEAKVEANSANGLSFFTFKNFITVFRDNDFWLAVKNTLLIAFVSVPVSLFLALIISVLLVSIKKLRGFFQTLYFLPYVTSSMAISMAFVILFVNPYSKTEITYSPINTAIRALGLEDGLMDTFDLIYWNSEGEDRWYKYSCLDEDGNQDSVKVQKKYNSEYGWYGSIGWDVPYTIDEYAELIRDTNGAAYQSYRHRFKSVGVIDWYGNNSTYETRLVILLIFSIWGGLAFKILVLTGGLTGIDKQYYDAAKIDGTSKWRTFFRITIPMVSPLLIYLLTTSFIGAFKTYTSVVGLFGANMGPDGSMTTFVGLIYKYLAGGALDSIHTASAASLILFVIIFVITKLLNKLTEKKIHY